MKIQYVFRHLDQSEFIKNFAKEHIERLLTRHSRTPNIEGTVKLEMENSPQHPGKDIYKCEIVLKSPHHGRMIVKKRTGNMYEAISEAADKLSISLEKVKGRFKSRRRRNVIDKTKLAMLAMAQ
ncbi:MAG: ribosome-associated translation inhibitor RaiA [Bdellovibrionota bacterium]